MSEKDKINHKNPEEVWGNLSDNGKKVAIVASFTGFSQNMEILEMMANDDKYGFDLEEGIRELSGVGVLEQITILQERTEMLENLRINYDSDDLILLEDSDVPREKIKDHRDRNLNLTGGDRKFLRLRRDINEYYQYKDKYPERYESWEKPRFRLTKDLQTYIEETFRPI